jgi:hypothetical protein
MSNTLSVKLARHSLCRNIGAIGQCTDDFLMKSVCLEQKWRLNHSPQAGTGEGFGLKDPDLLEYAHCCSFDTPDQNGIRQLVSSGLKRGKEPVACPYYVIGLRSKAVRLGSNWKPVHTRFSAACEFSIYQVPLAGFTKVRHSRNFHLGIFAC